jgi:CubicO group peptidase (beta-lactamase class C family)
MRADSVDELVQNEMQRHPIPGLALEIIQNGKPAKIAAYGMANLECRTPVTPETVFEIGSVTKQFTAAAILLLAQEGKLSVDDKISRHLKDTPTSWSNITLRHLLTHTSGLKNYTGLDRWILSRGKNGLTATRVLTCWDTSLRTSAGRATGHSCANAFSTRSAWAARPSAIPASSSRTAPTVMKPIAPDNMSTGITT